MVGKKKPLEYIVGYVNFKGLKFKIDTNVLIPRPETEYMIEEVVGFLKDYSERVNLLDIGTGSGVLGVCIKKLVSNRIKNLVLSDISEKALDVAKQNIKSILGGKEKNIYLIKSDLLLDIPREIFLEKFVIVANLPYIPNKVFEDNVEDNVKKWEPSIAFLGGHDGLSLYRRLLRQILKREENFIKGFFEMMGWQTDVLAKQYPYFVFKKKRTFHFNIKIVEVEKVNSV